MNIKNLNETLEKLLEWDSYAEYSLPNGDKDDEYDEYEPIINDKGTITINILGTDITYKVTEESYEDPRKQKLFGGIVLEMQNNDSDNSIYSIGDKLDSIVKEKINAELQKVITKDTETNYSRKAEQIAPSVGGAFIPIKIPVKMICRSK